MPSHKKNPATRYCDCGRRLHAHNQTGVCSHCTRGQESRRGTLVESAAKRIAAVPTVSATSASLVYAPVSLPREPWL